MSDIAIRVENLSKRYLIGKAIQHTDGNKPFLQKVTAPFRYLASTLRPPDEDEILWALKDVSFDRRLLRQASSATGPATFGLVGLEDCSGNIDG
ncbi:MAG: hypothetical protein ABIG63_22630 [Chloroflexota bacterium]